MIGDVHSPLCILFVDDDVEAVHVFRLFLSRLGHIVHSSRSGAEAEHQIASLHPDIVFLDLSLPDIDGFEVAKLIRHQPKFSETKIVAVTGFSDDAHRQRAGYAGFNGYLVKPVSLADIEAAVNHAREAILASGHDTHPHC
jgi:two-component system, OmpR family, response regulator